MVEVSMSKSDLMLESSLGLAESVGLCLGPVRVVEEDAINSCPFEAINLDVYRLHEGLHDSRKR